MGVSTGKTPKVSVCIPSYNHAQFLEECIYSVLNQTLQDLELIICDDASSDNTLTVIDKIRDQRLKLYQNESNIGPSATAIRANNLSQGEYIHILASDDVMLPDNLKLKVAVLDKYPHAGLVYSDALLINADGKSTGTYWTSEGYRPVRGKLNIQLITCVGNIIPAISVMMRRTVIDKVGYFDPSIKYAQDLDLWLRIAGEFDLEYISQPLVCWRQHEMNFHGRRDPQEYLDRVEVIKRITAKYPNIISTKLKKILLANCTAQAGLQIAQQDPKRARRFFADALAICYYHIPALIFYINSYLRLKSLWNFKIYKKLLLLILNWRRTDCSS